ncbi:single-stranded-DNA-specific exonuclease [Nitratiruptor sp. YY08-26]|uniref:single-stranded-DNA-specific exonuclease RecJ n=1 Tax=unclassified Nitratiruptor TaxID=2624044 RepID=UPI0019165493|nr:MULTISPECIES: single-stranded-DNA-specific exonuclease RecJ [unclassified Nitratiruptor]BCD61340.1 single-stranded-DNA-specific exonuclease [Nitratiruptor sp. YY08-13]BCD65273.1 single-stranded-DNA-specific exonuclease [Nitratiruptor sp. YY08-26]
MRKLTKDAIARILEERFQEGFVKLSAIPKPNTFKDMEKAAKRIRQAIEKREKIAVVGDYDVDGVVSTALMEEFFSYIEYPITTIIPNRFRHGYGLSAKVIDELGDVDLIITVDNGISAYDAAAICKERDIDLIITDHHTTGEKLPEAFAIVNPKQASCTFPYEEICGAQVAWFLIGQLKQELGLDLDMRRFLDILSIAIVADVMPLRHINRALLQAGLQAFARSKRPAIQFLRSVLKKHEFSSEDLGFSVAPVINSAGRMEDARLALEFLRSADFFTASVYYARLLACNSQRKAEERRVFKASLEFVDESKNVIVSVGEDWNEGVLGIVAARLTTKFQKPSIVLTKKENFYKGSGRSLGEVDLFALLQKNAHFLEKFGGHKKAAGLSLHEENLQEFQRGIEDATAKLPKDAFVDESNIMGELPFSEIDWELIDILERFAPYGESNPMPRFATMDVEVVEAREVGENGDHLLMTLRKDGRIFKAIKFKHDTKLTKSSIDIVYYPVKNIFNNSQYIQLFVTKLL